MTMDAAAKTIESLSKYILPQKPHHLSFHEDWRYRPPSADARDQEEWNNPRMQYLTMLSEADRGLLLTRPDYDMREELAKPAPREVNDLIRGNVEKKKLSLSDYKNKKTAATSTSTSTSPPEPLFAAKKEVERAPDARKPERPKPRESDPPAVEMKQRPPREPIVDMRLPPKPPTPKNPMPHFPRLPSPNMLNRKRVPDAEDESRPPKRPRPDAVRSGEVKPRPPRDDVQRRKDRAPPAPPSTTKDAPLHREERPNITSSSTLLNGKPTIKIPANATATDHASPAVRPRSESMNGTKPPGAGNTKSLSIKGEPKHDPSHKSSLPPLLSPLNLGLPFEDGDDDRSAIKSDKKRREDVRDRPKSPKHRKPDPPPAASRRQRSSPRIPPLLSPTLPPAVEAALELSKMMALDALDGKAKADKDPLSKKKRSKPIKKEDAEEDEPPQKAQRKSLIVTLKLPAGMRINSKRDSTTSSSAARRDTSARDHDRSNTDDSSQPAQARKRPVASADTPSETIALKKPRATEAPATTTRPSAPPAPSTPSNKKGPTAMSRVSSSNSLAQTPGDAVPTRPSTSAAAPVDRRVNGSSSGQQGPEGGPQARILRDKEFRFLALGRKLKHEADLMMRPDRSHPGGGANGRDANPKLGYVLSVESLLAFMAGFHAQNLHRLMSNKKCDPTVWLTLFPFMDFIQDNIRRHEPPRKFLPLFSLHLLLHAVAVDELLKCYAALDNPAAVKIEEILRFERTRSRIWPQIRETNELIEQKELRVDVHPWATLDEITVLSSRILKRWCADEKVTWTLDSSLKEPVGGKAGQQ